MDRAGSDRATQSAGSSRPVPAGSGRCRSAAMGRFGYDGTACCPGTAGVVRIGAIGCDGASRTRQRSCCPDKGRSRSGSVMLGSACRRPYAPRDVTSRRRASERAYAVIRALGWRARWSAAVAIRKAMVGRSRRLRANPRGGASCPKLVPGSGAGFVSDRCGGRDRSGRIREVPVFRHAVCVRLRRLRRLRRSRTLRMVVGGSRGEKRRDPAGGERKTTAAETAVVCGCSRRDSAAGAIRPRLRSKPPLQLRSRQRRPPGFQPAECPSRPRRDAPAWLSRP